MGIFSAFKSAAAKVTVIHPKINIHDNINSDFDVENGIISTILTCQKILSESLGKLPLEVMQSTSERGKVKHKQHYLYRKLHNNPNGWMTSTMFVQQLEYYRNKYGNSYAKIHRDGAGKVHSLELIHPSEIVGYKILNGQLYYYRNDGDKIDEVLNSTNLLHYRFISNDGVFGLNPVQALYQELNNIHHGKLTLNNAYKNNLNINKYIETSIPNFSVKGVGESIEKLKEDYQGSINTGKVLTLPQGFKVVPLPSNSFQDAQILQSINFSKAAIYELFGIPVPERKSYASIEQESINFKANTMAPICRMYRQEFESKLLTDKEIEEGVSIEFNLTALLETTINDRVNYLKTLHGMGVVSANQVAKIESFETFDGGDNRYMQMQYQPINNQEKTKQENEGKEDN